MASAASINAAAKVASAGSISRNPVRTMTIDNSATANANRPSRPDQAATFETGAW